ncbi:MAG: crossover junction endodeoxyribonuclease RuvC [Opitutaceae bacterium]
MARMTSRQLWAAKLAGKAMPGRVVDLPSAVRRPFNGRILGVDPSLRGTGLAVVEFRPGASPLLLHCRTLLMKKTVSMPECLAGIYRGIAEALDTHSVEHVALEQTIYVQNFQTAQILGAARGAAIAAAAVAGKAVFEYPPLRVKQAVVGVGRASKEQMARTVMAMLGHGATLAYDEADAVGVALCHAFTWRETGV